MRVNFPAMVVCITQLSNLSCINIMYKPAKLTIFISLPILLSLPTVHYDKTEVTSLTFLFRNLNLVFFLLNNLPQIASRFMTVKIVAFDKK